MRYASPRPWPALAAFLVLAAGCSLNRTPLIVPQDGRQNDLDGGLGGHDAGRLEDAFVPPPRVDAGHDAAVKPDGGPDAFVPTDAGPVCVGRPEVCDGRDNDCDPSTPDGTDDSSVGVSCDGPDSDLCANGTSACVGGVVTCPATGLEHDGILDVCDGMDNDCNPATPDGADEPGYGTACDGDDADLCADGMMACVDGAMVCDDSPDSNVETCNGLDDDCNGHIDDGAGCPCGLQAENGGHAYFFCGHSDRRSWTDASAYCAMYGYELVTIDDAGEQTWVASEAQSYTSDKTWWIGANDRDTEGSFVWVGSGFGISYENWNDGEPNDSGSGEDCVEMQAGTDSASGTPGGWNDYDCTNGQRFICEAGP